MAFIHCIWKLCPMCKGEKVVPANQKPDEGEYEPEMITCPHCNGVGEILWGKVKDS